ncbi:MAG TPA: putative lipid II flippase FtsW [Treponemataceae bacterium]|nr:putative lipid II flippase FtsW [Treponemataceae bacterium]
MNERLIQAEQPFGREMIDLFFVLLLTLMIGVGLTTLFSGSLSYGERFFNDPMYFVKKQIVNLLIGIAALSICSFIRFDFLRSMLPKLVLLTLILTILPFIPGIGITKNGSSRWIGIGSSTFQPSELVKLVLVLFLANLFDKKHEYLDDPTISVYPAAIMSGIFISLVYLQNDFSTSVFLLITVMVMFYVSGVSISFFIKISLVLLPLSALMILTKEYRVERVLSFLDPSRDPLGAGYQVNAALTALSEGGFWGRGLGNGIRKISGIPEVQNDFIFAVWGEEMGFMGVSAYFILLSAFCVRGYQISLRSTSRFAFLLGFGSVTLILVQSLMNCGVVVRAFPATGIPLPFFSSGGSSLLISLCLSGFIINVSRSKSRGEV